MNDRVSAAIVNPIRKITAAFANKTTQWIMAPILCCGILSGCESRAELKDIEPIIREAWSTCSFVKVENLRKVNGLSRGEEYVLSIGYDLIVQYEVVPNSDKLGSTSAFTQTCKGGAQRIALARLTVQQFGYQKGSKKGQALAVAGEYTFVHPENGWVLSSAR